MRFPWLQVDSDFIAAHAADLAAHLDMTRREAIGLAVDLWTWALARAPDDAPPEGLVTGTGAVPDRLLAGSIGWTGPAERFTAALVAVGMAVRIDDGYRLTGFGRYKSTWERNRRRTGGKPEVNRSGSGGEPARKTQTQTQTQIKATTTTAGASRAAEVQAPPRPEEHAPQAPTSEREDEQPSPTQQPKRARKKPEPQEPVETPIRRQLSDVLCAVYQEVCGCKYPFTSRDGKALSALLELVGEDVAEAAARFRWALSDAAPWNGGPPPEGRTKFIYRLPAVWAALALAPKETERQSVQSGQLFAGGMVPNAF